MIEILIAISILFLIIASYFDLKTGEIPERLSRSYIFSIGSLALIYSFFVKDISILFYPALVGFGYFLFSYVTYYIGQWGGGDVKILTGIGITIGFLGSLDYGFSNSLIFPYYIGYFINMGFIALPYAFAYGLILGFKNRKIFHKFFISFKEKKFRILLFFLSFLPSLISFYFDFIFLSEIYIIIPAFVLISFFLKTIEKEALIKEIRVKDLKEGDVPYRDLTLGKEKISSKDINGLTDEQVEKIKKLSIENKFQKKMKIKFGIKFVPILALSFIALLLFGNVLELLLL